MPQSVAVTDECQLVDLTIAYFFSKIKFFLHFFPTYFFRQKRSYPVSSSSHAIQVSIIQSCHPVSISISILVSIIQSCHPVSSIHLHTGDPAGWIALRAGLVWARTILSRDRDLDHLDGKKRSYPVSIIQSCHPVSISISISISILVSIIQSCHPGISILVIQHTLRSIGLLCHRMDSTGCVVCGHPARKKKEDRRSILFSSHFYKNSIYLIFEKVTHGFAIGDPVSVCT